MNLMPVPCLSRCVTNHLVICVLYFGFGIFYVFWEASIPFLFYPCTQLLLLVICCGVILLCDSDNILVSLLHFVSRFLQGFSFEGDDKPEKKAHICYFHTLVNVLDSIMFILNSFLQLDMKLYTKYSRYNQQTVCSNNLDA